MSLTWVNTRVFGILAGYGGIPFCREVPLVGWDLEDFDTARDM